MSPEPEDLPSLRFLSDQQATEENVAQIQTLFDREPWIFGPETFTGVWQDLQNVPWRIQVMLNRWSEYSWQAQDSLWLGAALLLLLLFGLFFWIDFRFQQLPAKLVPLMPAAWPGWSRRLIKVGLVVLARLALGLCLLFGVHLLWGAFQAEQRWFPLLVDLLWVGLIYRGLQTALHESLLQERQTFFREIPEATLKRLYWRLNGFSLYAALHGAVIVAFRDLGYRTDFVDLLQFAFYAALLLFATFLISRKADVFSLFPEIDEPVYQRFLRFFKRFYLWVAAFTLLQGLLWIAGYRYLAEILFLRSWAVVGLVLLVRLAQRLARRLLLNSLVTDTGQTGLVEALQKGLWLIEALVLLNGILALLGIRQPLFAILSQPIAAIGDRSVISPLSFLNGLLVLLVFFLITQIANAFLEERVFPKINPALHQMISMSLFYSVMALGLLVALNVVGLDLSVFAIFAGALAFGIGFGLQGIAKNFASGVVLVFTGLVKKGDYVSVGEHMGYIQEVSWKRVLLRTPDAVDLIIPTVDMVESKIVNWSYSNAHTRVHLSVGVAYDSDLEQVKKALFEAAAMHEAVLKEPEPAVWLTAFGDSALELELLVWIDCKQIPVAKLKGELNFMIWQVFQKHGIQIPFPQRDLHLRSGLEALSVIQKRPAGEAERFSES
ncbi:MAG: mechanosensitive ion channel [Candidatus Sericytochromatia bacterium]|nr:mechanosensitive ion channel [Candidatus Sericytochromatia bacterium]